MIDTIDVTVCSASVATCTLPAVSFGSNIRRLRSAVGIRTQRELADRLGVPQPQVSDWENDRYAVLETGTLLRLAKALHCSVDQLLSGVDPDYDRVREATAAVPGDVPTRIDLLRGAQADIPVVAEGDAAPVPIRWRGSKPAPPQVLLRLPRPGDLDDPDAYGVEVRSDAMLPAHRPRSIAIVAPRRRFEDGDEVYAQLVSGERSIRVVTKTTGAYLLQPYNLAYPARVVKRRDMHALHVIVYSRRREP
ncbi:MAG: helix-turn-helix domain-containing protein [Acidobacteria bacterium]|nr:helix-turn-helix domain-containing protein [Acidobacteriota bacterium]